MKFDSCEYDYKSCYVHNKNNWFVKEKPDFELIDEILHEEVCDEKPHIEKWNRAQITMLYFKHMKQMAKNLKDEDFYDYYRWAQYHFNQRFHYKFQLDKYFGR